MCAITRRELCRNIALSGAASVWLRPSSSGRAVSAATTDASVTIATNRAPSDLDPQSAYDAGSGVPLQGPFESLIRLKPGSIVEYTPLLAERWQSNADQSVWTFTLRPDLTFQDGTPCDAAAVRDSFQRLFTLGLAPSTVLGRFLQDATQIATPDPQTVVFDLERPQPLFEAAIAAPYGAAIVNARAAKAHEVDGDWGHGWAQTSADGMGTGPYRITRFDPADAVVLDRFDGYWGGWEGQHLDRVVIRIVAEGETRRQLIENGAVDVAENVPPSAIPALEKNSDVVVIHRYNLAVNYVAMTVAGPLESPAARQALCWAFPYDDVIKGVLDGFAKRAIGPVAELCRGFDPATFVYQTDLDRARGLLDQAGIAGNTTLTMLLLSGNQRFEQIFELLGANLETLGLKLEPTTVDFATYLAIATGDQPAAERPHLVPSFWQPDYNDAWNHLWPQLSCQAWTVGNIGHYCNAQVEDLLARARDAADDQTYRRALSTIQQIVTRDDPAAIYYAQPEWITVLRKDLGGLVLNPIVSEIHDFYGLHRTD
ncbi:MAG TPA: ABC transporter substrate-binding protein [Thermomicrobiales bacterium]|jgi:peptide/nickel transport system substrate-binding protein